MINPEKAGWAEKALCRLSESAWSAAYRLGRVERGQPHWLSAKIYMVAVAVHLRRNGVKFR